MFFLKFTTPKAVFSWLPLFLVLFYCAKFENSNPCDPSSKQNQNFQILKSVIGTDLSNCTKAQTSSFNSKEITLFSFVNTINGFSRTYVGTISGSNIAITIPYGTRSSAIASFVHTGKMVSVSDVTQVSGNTINNFTSSIVYRIAAEDGSIQEYKLITTPLFLIPDTAQTSCWDQAGALLGSCSGIGHDGSFENTPNSRNFSAPTAHATFTSDIITFDRLNGLTWKTCAEGFSGGSCNTGGTTSTFTNSSTSCSNLNSLNSGSGYAGKRNWRVPTIIELASIANYENVSPTLALDTASFPGTLVANTFWSSSPNAANTANSWVVNYSNNSTGDLAIATAANVRCVAGDLPPAPSFTDNGDSTVTDNNTKLIWSKCSDGLTGATCTGGGLNSPILATTLTSCNGYSLAGKTWRLPNTNELRSLLDYSLITTPMINSAFPNTSSNQYWTSTSNVNSPNLGMLVYFNSGGAASLSKASPRPFRCLAN
jgi:hypothetical protein